MFRQNRPNILVAETHKRKLSSKIVKALQAMYCVVKSCIRYKSNTSNFIDSKVGVKQGDPSSSLMFLFFVNDILNHINTNIDGIFTINEVKLFMLLFADDAVLFAETPQALQSMLNDLEQYCNEWELKININKTKKMIFEKGRHTTHNFTLYDSILKIVQVSWHTFLQERSLAPNPKKNRTTFIFCTT